MFPFDSQESFQFHAGIGNNSFGTNLPAAWFSDSATSCKLKATSPATLETSVRPSDRDSSQYMSERPGIKLSASVDVEKDTQVWNAVAAGKIFLECGRYDLASRSFLHGIRLRPSSSQILGSLVSYNFFSRLQSSLDSYASSAQRSSIPAREAMLTFANALVAVPYIEPKHSLVASLLLVSAQLNLDNVASASLILADVRNSPVLNHDERAAIQRLETQIISRGGAEHGDRRPPSSAPQRICYASLRMVPASTVMLSCSICPAKFCDQAVQLKHGDACTMCRSGSIL